MFAEDVGRIGGVRDVLEVNCTGCHGFLSEVVGQGMVPLLQRRMWGRCVGHNGAIVTKHPG